MSAPWIVLFVALWLVVVVETVMVLGLSRRLTALESTGIRVLAPAAANGAVAVGTALPAAALDRLGLPSADPAADRSLVLFLSHGCGPCVKLADELRQVDFEREFGDDLEVAIVTDEAGAAEFTEIGRIVVDPGGTLAHTLGVRAMPSGIVVDEGVVRGVGITTSVHEVRRLAASRELRRRSTSRTSGLRALDRHR